MIFIKGVRRREKVGKTEERHSRERERQRASNDCQLHHDCRWGLGTSVTVPLIDSDCSLYKLPRRAADASSCANGVRYQFTASSRCTNKKVRYLNVIHHEN